MRHHRGKPDATENIGLYANPFVLCTRSGLPSTFININICHVGLNVRVKDIEKESWIPCDDWNTNKGRTLTEHWVGFYLGQKYIVMFF